MEPCVLGLEQQVRGRGYYCLQLSAHIFVFTFFNYNLTYISLR